MFNFLKKKRRPAPAPTDTLGCIIRTATAANIPVLVALRKQLLMEEGAPPWARNPLPDLDAPLGDYFARAITDGSFVAWVAETDGEIIATGGLCFYALPPTFSEPAGQAAYITNMYTRNEYRRRGIATALLHMAIGEAKARGYAAVRLHASKDGKPIYQKAGFVDSYGYMAMRL